MSAAEPAKSKILVIDNDKDFLKAWIALLTPRYHVYPYENVGTAAATLHAIGCHLALVDRRATSDREERDRSGQELAVQLCQLGTPCVLLSAFLPDDQELFDLLRRGGLSGVASKTYVDELPECIEEFIASHRFPNAVADFAWKASCDDVFGLEDWKQVKDRLSTPATPEEFAVLLRSLIPSCATRVKLESIAAGRGGAALLRAKVSCGDGPVIEDLAIKYGDRALIRSEAMNYDRHVGPLPDGVACHLRWRKETKLLGALAYSWVGDSIEDGVPFGPTSTKQGSPTWRRRRAAIERLFSVSLNPWYRVYRSWDKTTGATTLLDYYVGEGRMVDEIPFRTSPLPVDLPSPVTSDASAWTFGTFGKKVNPAQWLATAKVGSTRLLKYCPSHGDLHVKNIFILPDDSPRLIDFGDTALGHVFRDFAALEASVRLTCGSSSELAMLKMAAEKAGETADLGAYLDYRTIPEALDDLRETLKMTTQIRRAALDATGDHAAPSHFREYLFALALRLLRYASGIADEVSSKESAEQTAARKWHALYAAACAAEQAERLV